MGYSLSVDVSVLMCVTRVALLARPHSRVPELALPCLISCSVDLAQV